MSKKSKHVLCIILNLMVAVFQTIAMSWTAPERGFGMFIYFTELSNFFAQIACICSAAALIRFFAFGLSVPGWVKTLKYVAACSLALTFWTVVFVLGPMSGGTLQAYAHLLFYKHMLFTHTINPIIVMLSFLLLDDFHNEKISVSFLGIIPTVLYAIVAIIMNALGKWDGPYPFLKVLDQPVWASLLWTIALLGLSYLLSFGLWKLKKIIVKKSEN